MSPRSPTWLLEKSKFLSVSHTWVCCSADSPRRDEYCLVSTRVLLPRTCRESAVLPRACFGEECPPPLAWKRSLYKAGWIPCPLVSKCWVLLHVFPQPSGTCATYHTLSPALSGPWSWCGSQNAGFCLSAPYLGTPVWLAGKLFIFPQSSFWGDVPVRGSNSGALLSQLRSFLRLCLHLAFVCESFCESLSYTRECAESLVG